MKKIIFSCMALSLIALCSSLSIQAQSSEEELDQEELFKQFIGDWKVEFATDTFLYWHITPIKDGYIETGEYTTNGKTFMSFNGIFGINPSKINIRGYTLYEGGRIIGTFGRFIAKDKFKASGWNANHQINFDKMEITFLTPDKFQSKGEYRRWDAENWDDAVAYEYIWERVKE